MPVLKKILHIMGSVDPRSGGPIESVLRQAEGRSSLGIETHIVSLDRPSDSWVTIPGVTVFPVGSRNIEGPRRGPLWLRYGYVPHTMEQWITQHASDYDAIVVEGLWSYATLAARRSLVRLKKPYVVFTHGMLDPWFRRTYPLKHVAKQFVWWFTEGPLLANAAVVMFTCEEERRLALGAFWPYRCVQRVVNFGTADFGGEAQTQIKSFQAAVPSLSGRSFLLYLSRIHPKKGCDLLIEAFARIAPSHPQLDLVLAGPDQVGWRKELEARARDLGIAHRLHWPGMLRDDVKLGAYRCCDAFVLPSHQENFGIVVAEAMAAEKPVLITNRVNIWRDVVAADCGIVANDDLEGVHDLLKRYLALSSDQVRSMGKRARECFLRYFEIQQCTRSILQVLSEFADK